MAPPPSSLPIGVLGAGVSGLSAAYFLTQRGYHVRLFEAGSRAGGVIQSERHDDWLLECGPNSLLENSRELVELISALGLDAERVVANPAAKKRFIVRGGKLCAVPMSPLALIRTPLFSAGSKLRLLTELFTRPKTRDADVSLAALIGEHFGTEIVDYALNPFVSGVYAGDPTRLSARLAFPSLWEGERSRGSLIRAQIAQAKIRRKRGEPKGKIISFRNGLQTLTDALVAGLPADTLMLRAKVLSLSPGKSWSVTWNHGGEARTEQCSAVISALPADALSQLSFGAQESRPFAVLSEIEHPPVASLFLGFRREQVAHPLDGFGALVPAREQRKVLGALFSSTLFPGRAPAGHVALTVLAGGALRPEMARLGADELTAELLPELDGLLGVTGTPVFRRLHAWPRAIPQYNLGYERFLEALAACKRNHPGLFIGGQVSDGISVPSCVAAGRKLAEEAMAFM